MRGRKSIPLDKEHGMLASLVKLYPRQQPEIIINQI